MNIQDLTEDIEISKNNLYEIFCSKKTGKLSSPLLKWSMIKKHHKLYEFLITYYKGVNDKNTSASEIFYRIINNISTHPVCPMCGQLTTFKRIRDGYYTCCDECKRNGNWRKYNGQLNVKQSLEKYGVTSLMKLQVNKDKVRKTCQARYGVDTVSQLPEFVEKQKKAFKEKYSDSAEGKAQLKEKRKQTSLLKYGVEHPAQTKEVQDKMKATCVERYGVPNPQQNADIRKKLLQTMHDNHSFGTSKVEKEVEQYFIRHKVNYIRQYSSDVYQHLCDFYLLDFNLYIEIQGAWTHGKHPFNPNNPDDIILLNYWKSKGNAYYDTAVKVWSNSDVNKRKAAQLNNLNYLEIFSYKAEEVISSVKNYLNLKLSGYVCDIYAK